MNIYTLRDNLKQTIAGKSQMLEQFIQRKDVKREAIDNIAYVATVEFLKVNIDELKKILVDVEVCCTQASEASWIINPERMGR